jgi:integrase
MSEPARRVNDMDRRRDSSMRTLTRRHVDLARGTLTLDPGTTKNDDGRVCYLPPDLVARLRTHLDAHDALQKKLKRVIPRVFVHLRGPAPAGRSSPSASGGRRRARPRAARGCCSTTCDVRRCGTWSGPPSRSASP